MNDTPTERVQEFGMNLTMNEMISMVSISAIKRFLAGKGIEA